MTYQLDPFTLAVLAVCCACLGWGAVALHAIESRNERDGAVANLAWGMGFQACGSLLLCLGGIWLQPWCMALAQTLFTVALLLWLAGVRRLARRQPRLDWLALLAPGSLLLALAQALLLPRPALALLVPVFFQLPLALLLARELSRLLAVDEISWVRRTAITVLLLHATALCALALAGLSGKLDFAPPGPLGQWLDLLVFNLCLPLSLLLLSAHLLRARLSSLVRHDALTGLLNRRGMEELALRELRRARKRNGKLGVILFDLDQFRLVNDRYGFAVGDAALKTFSHQLRAAAPEGSWLGRVGGDEFCILLELNGGGSLAALRSRLGLLLGTVDIDSGDVAIRQPASLGWAVMGLDGEEFEVLLQVAAQRLQQGRKGRDTAGEGEEAARDSYVVSEATIARLQMEQGRPALP
ncbi:GGDEF domain-containing protein [Chitinilyticum aquatile]|uniref:GGDEF domain-containing protein n=1 Tax=Chitinilyticum aquatile TaxID=362520 RepID=UPI0003F5792E|nr:GGDEF domain-containing protein [Chitinilyticum aquatile]